MSFQPQTSADVRKGIRFRDVDHCPSCGGQPTRVVLPNGEDFETGLGTFCIKECGQCGVQFTSPQPYPEDVHLLYADRATSDFDSSSSFIDRLRRYKSNRQLQRLLRNIPQNVETALDYGCGSGFFTVTMRAHLSGRVIGSDFDAAPPGLILKSAGIGYVSEGNIDQLQGQLDLIVCRHVLEHSTQPARFIARLTSLLKPGGFIMIAVPNRRSIWNNALGKYCFHYYLPRHLFHFDQHSLTRQLDGLEITDMWHDHSPILGRSLGYWRGKPIGGFSLLGILLVPLQIFADTVFGRSTEIFVVAKKPQ